MAESNTAILVAVLLTLGTSTAGPACSFKERTNSAAGTLKQLSSVADPAACCSLCYGFSGCNSFVWTNGSWYGQQCYLKGTAGAASSLYPDVSATYGEAVPPTPSPSPGVHGSWHLGHADSKSIAAVCKAHRAGDAVEVQGVVTCADSFSGQALPDTCCDQQTKPLFPWYKEQCPGGGQNWFWVYVVLSCIGVFALASFGFACCRRQRRIGGDSARCILADPEGHMVCTEHLDDTPDASTRCSGISSSVEESQSTLAVADPAASKINHAIRRQHRAAQAEVLATSFGNLTGNVIPPLRGVAASLEKAFSYCRARASNDEEAAKAQARLQSLVPALEQVASVLVRSPESERIASPALAELERSLLNVAAMLSDLECKRSTVRLGNMTESAFRDRFACAIEDVERARNDVLLHLNLAVMRVALDGNCNDAAPSETAA